MLITEHTDIYGFEAAIRGMRNPMNSWGKSDSFWCIPDGAKLPCDNCANYNEKLDICKLDELVDKKFVIGDNDLQLMKNLCVAGTDHSKFMRFINVTVDIIAPLYWWKEFDTYKVGTVANSCSTMHKIHAKRFTLDDFSVEHLNDESITAMNKIIWCLNRARDNYIEFKNKEYWWQMIQILPSSYNQRRTVQLNYQVLQNIYHARKNHKLDEWHTFCDWVERLPYSELITGGEHHER